MARSAPDMGGLKSLYGFYKLVLRYFAQSYIEIKNI